MRHEVAAGLLARFHGARIAVVGDVMLDRFIYGAARRISPEAPVPVLAIDRVLDMPGGAANVARNIASLGARCTLFGAVGSDTSAADLRRQLDTYPGLTTRLVVDLGRPTSLKIRYVAEGQQVMRADWERCVDLSADVANALLAQLEEAIEGHDVLVLSDYAKGVLTDSLLRAAIRLSHRAGKPVIVDPKSSDWRKYAGATVITPNRVELEEATHKVCSTNVQVEEAALPILADGICSMLVVTRGADGLSIIKDSESITHLPAEARQVFDVSGAGDTVVATLALGMASGGLIEDSASLANVAAGIVVSKRGTATVGATEILERLPPPLDDGTESRKIYSLERVLPLVNQWRDQGRTIAFTNGCFDLLHPGHISLLDQAARAADRLVVGLNADESVARLKGPARPLQGEVARATVLAALKQVAAVVIFREDTPLRLIRAIRPDVLVKGSDYTVESVVGADDVIHQGGRVVLAKLLKGHSTSATVTRVLSSLVS